MFCLASHVYENILLKMSIIKISFKSNYSSNLYRFCGKSQIKYLNYSISLHKQHFKINNYYHFLLNSYFGYGK